MNAFITTSYVSRMCAVPPLVARAGLAHMITTDRVLGGDGWELRFGDRDGPGLLTAGWTQRASVDVEIERWSKSRVLVGIRHRARAVPWWSAAYFTSAHEAAGLIVTSLEQWADEPLRSFARRAADRVARDRAYRSWSILWPRFFSRKLARTA